MKEVSIGRLVSILYRQSQSYINQALRDLDISSSECIFLKTLYNNEGINQEEISSLLIIDKAATARGIKSLEEKGLVIRTADQNDKRAKKVFTTEKGKSYEEKINNTLREWTELITKGIDEESFNIVITSLTTMIEKNGDKPVEKSR